MKSIFNLKNIKPLLKNRLFWLVLVFAFFITLPETASAFIGVSPADIFIYLVKALAYLINYIAGMVFAAAGFLVKLAFDFNAELLGPKNTLIHVGWQITRDIANFGFVVVMIGIAFSFIIGYEKYGTWNMLKNLIIAAITINFSFAIVGVIVEFSDSITRYFLSLIEPNTKATLGGLTDPVTGGDINAFGYSLDLNSYTLGDRVALKLADAFGPQRFFVSDENPLPFNPEDQVGGLITFGTAALNSIAGIFFSIVFTIIGALTLFGLAIMLFVRFLHLTVLVITAPLAWLTSAIPDLKQHYDKWWKDLIKWVFFAPQVTFFIYLALVFVNAIADSGIIPPTAGNYASAISTVLIQGINMAIVCAILLEGLKTAESTGITGGKLAMEWAKDTKKFSMNYLRQRGKNMGNFVVRNTLGTETGRKIVNRLQQIGHRDVATYTDRHGNTRMKKGSLVANIASRAINLGTLGATSSLGRGLGNLLDTAIKTSDSDLAAAETEIAKMSRAEKIRAYAGARGSMKAAIAKDLGKVYNDATKNISDAEKELLNKLRAQDSAEKRHDNIEKLKLEARLRNESANKKFEDLRASKGEADPETMEARFKLEQSLNAQRYLHDIEIPSIQAAYESAQAAYREAEGSLKKAKLKHAEVLADINNNSRHAVIPGRGSFSAIRETEETNQSIMERNADTSTPQARRRPKDPYEKVNIAETRQGIKAGIKNES